MTRGNAFVVEPAGGAADYAQAIALLDRVFVAPRQRPPSVAVRFPWISARDARGNAWTLNELGVVTACLLVKCRRWASGGGGVEVAMIGGVCTDPAARGRGLASELMRHVQDALDAAGIETQVLWTTMPRFYERLGWRRDESGLLGTLGVYSGPRPKAQVSRGSPAASFERLARIRGECLGEGVGRHRDDWASIPFPAQSVECVRALADDGEAYGLVGRAGSSAYVYEVVGPTSVVGAVWADIRDRYSTVLVNERRDGPMVRWLAANAAVDWRPGATAMWRGAARFYVPFFDGC